LVFPLFGLCDSSSFLRLPQVFACGFLFKFLKADFLAQVTLELRDQAVLNGDVCGGFHLIKLD